MASIWVYWLAACVAQSPLGHSASTDQSATRLVVVRGRAPTDFRSGSVRPAIRRLSGAANSQVPGSGGRAGAVRYVASRRNVDRQLRTVKRSSGTAESLDSAGGVRPGWGIVLAGFPIGATRVEINSQPFWQRGGVYFREAGYGCEVVPPPIGALVEALPCGSLCVAISGHAYYVHMNLYFAAMKREWKLDSAGPRAPASLVYKVIEPPIGAIVTDLWQPFTLRRTPSGLYFKSHQMWFRATFHGINLRYQRVAPIAD